MGREIRRVPPNWEHPQDHRRYIPLLDSTYEEAFEDWEEYGKADGDDPPVHAEYRPAFEQEPTAYQIYEDVTEGTPVSPVFETLNALIDWLVEQGHSRQSAEDFAEAGWVPSRMISGGRFAMNIDIFDMEREIEA